MVSTLHADIRRTSAATGIAKQLSSSRHLPNSKTLRRHLSDRYRLLLILRFSILLAALGALATGRASATVSAMWGSVPPQANGNFTYFQSDDAACRYAHSYYSPQTTYEGVTPSKWGFWNTHDCHWPPKIGWSLPGSVSLHCVDGAGNYAVGYKLVPPGDCISTADPDTSRPAGCYYNDGANFNPTASDPIILSTGSLYETVTDYADSDRKLTISRVYRSRQSGSAGSFQIYGEPDGLGQLWRLNFQWEIATAQAYFSNNGTFVVTAPDGSNYAFKLNSDGTVSPLNFGISDLSVQYVGSGPINYNTILSTGAKFVITTSAGDQILMQLFQPYYSSYFLMGHPLKITYRGGYAWSFTYGSQSQLERIVDSYGRLISFTWYSATVDDTSTTYPLSIQSITLPDGTALNYTYESYLGDQSADTQYERLKQFTRTKAGSVVDSDTYLYTDPNSPLHLTGIVDNSGIQAHTWQYDLNGHVTNAADADGTGSVSVSYSINANQTYTYRTTTNALGLQTVYTYKLTSSGADPLLTSIVGNPTTTCIGTTETIAYDANSRRSSVVDANGNETSYTYGTDGRFQTVVEAVGTAQQRTTQYTWNDQFGVPTQVVKPGVTTNLSYDGSGRLLQRQLVDTTTQTIPYTTNGNTRSWTYTYDSTTGLLTTIEGPGGLSDVTTYGYNANGYIASVTDALGHSVQYTSLDASGHPLTIAEPNGAVTSLLYDGANRLVSRSTAGETSTFTYTPVGLLSQATLADGSYIGYSYDDADRLTKISDSAGDAIVYTLDAMGDRTAENVYDPNGTLVRTHSRVFDSLGRVFEEINAAGTPAVTTNFSYDGNGNLTVTAAPLYRNTINAYDPLNRLNQITDPAGGITQFGYSASDQLTSVSDPRGLMTSYIYSGLGDLIQQNSPDTGTSTSTYDADGNLVMVTDARGAVADYGYDVLNRVTSIAYSLGGSTDQTVTLTYDQGTYGIGHLTGASDANHSMGFTYDALGEITGVSQTVGGIGLSVGYAFTNGNLTTLTTPSGQVIAYGYNSNHQVTSIAVNGTTVLSNASYEPFGRLGGWSWGNGSTFTRTFDEDGDISGISTTGSQESLSYDNASRISGITNTAQGSSGWTYSYDSLDRLTSATTSSVTEGWTYDANGNRLSETGTSPSTYSIAPANNQITAISGTLTRSYAYDAAGDTLGDSTDTDTFNDAGRLKTISNASGTTSFIYNALGQMIETSGLSGTILYVYDQAGHLLGEYDGSGNLVQETVWLGDVPVATIRSSGSSVAIYYVETDQLNTPRAVIRPRDNTQIWTWFSGPFGSEAPDTNPQGAGTFSYDLRFPGQIAGAWGSTYQNGFRDLDPAVGGYVESDLIGLKGGSYSTYEYAKSEPVGAMDPLGLAWHLRGSKVDDVLQNLPDMLCDYWPAYCMSRLLVCTEARCTYHDHCGNTWYIIVNNWVPGPWPAPWEVPKQTPNCVCIKWKFREDD